jgi:hypothetical protein
MAEDKYKTEEEIDVLPGNDPDVIGKHFQELNKARLTDRYTKLGEKVEFDYTKSDLPDGGTKVNVVTHHK